MNIIYFIKLYKNFFNLDYTKDKKKEEEDEAIVKMEEAYVLKPKEIEMQIFKINNEKYVNRIDKNLEGNIHTIYAAKNKFTWLFK
jgi:hypothetical protein